MLHVPRPQRVDLQALWDLDSALGDVVKTTSEPMIGQIRLAWWRERLEAIDAGEVADEPRLKAVADMVARTGLTGKIIAPLADFWVPVLNPFPWEDGEEVGWIARRGAELFGWSAMILSPSCGDDEIRLAGSAGALWAEMDVARHLSSADEREILRDVALFDEDKWTDRIVPPALRPLTMLGLLAQRDAHQFPRFEPEATPARAWAMIAHRLTGKIRI